MRTIKLLPQRPYRLRRDDKLYFLHVYKTAGTTLSMLLERLFQPAEVCPAHQIDGLVRLTGDSARRYRLYWGHLGFKLAEFVPDELIYITMLRDPVQHVVSIYEAIRRGSDHPMHERANRPGETIVDFLRDEQTALNIRDHQLFTLTLWHEVWDSRRTVRRANGALSPSDWHAMRQEAFTRLRNTPGPELVELALRRLERFAFVGLVERMADSMALLARTFDWAAFPEVPRLNAAPSRQSRDGLTEEALEEIRNVTRLDAQLYAHAQATFERHLRAMKVARLVDGSDAGRRMAA